MTCDLEALRHYPMRETLKSKAYALTMPEIFFADPNKPRKEWVLGERLRNDFFASDEERQNALARGLSTFDPSERGVLMLAAISKWTISDTPLTNFFVMGNGAHYEDVVRTLDELGIAEHAALFREGRALFGPEYGTSDDRDERLSDGHGTILDQALDTSLSLLNEHFKALPDLIDIAVSRVAASPDLMAIFEPARLATSDDDRLAYLGQGLWTCVPHYGPTEEVSRYLSQLPDAARHIAVTFVFYAEMLNAGVSQFFSNSSGTLAPDVVPALAAMGLDQYADSMQICIDLFPRPYPRDLRARRKFLRRAGDKLDHAIDAICDEMVYEEILSHMVRMARQAGILPE